MKPCRCGHATEPGICRHGQNVRCASDYQVRLSGPLIERIDPHVEVPAATAADGPPRDATNAVSRVHLAETLPYQALADEMRRAA
jgi:magnesium chelatase family protein